MNVAASHSPPPLHDLLGASFVFNTAVCCLAWNGEAACFGLDDGAVALLQAVWPGAPCLAPRPGGGIEIVPVAAPPPPPLIVQAHPGGVLALAHDPLGGLISGGQDGRCLRIDAGKVSVIASRPRRRIAAVAAGRGGRRAFAAGRQVDQVGPDARRMSLPGMVTALEYDPSGLHLAIGYVGGVSLEACSIRSQSRLSAAGAHRLLRWNNDGSVIAVARPQGGVAIRVRDEAAWRVIDGVDSVIGSMAFTSDGALIMADADAVMVWHDGSPVQQLTLGFGTTCPAGPVACHPRLGLVACADRDGGILLCRPGVRDPIVIREPGTPPHLLAFAPDGEALAFATVDGEAGTVILPDAMFRRGES